MAKNNKNRIISGLVAVFVLAGVLAIPAFSQSNDTAAAGKKIKINFKANGGSFVKFKHKTTKGKKKKRAMKSKKVTVGKKYGTLSKVKRTGYKFKGWYNKKNRGKRITKKTKVKTSKKQTLYARWEARTYTVSFDSKGGHNIADIKVKYNSKLGNLATPKRPGCAFLGWYDTNNQRVKDGTTYTIAGNTVLHAKWSVGNMGIDTNYIDVLGKLQSNIAGISKTSGPITINGNRYETFTDSKDMEFLFENGICISINGNKLLSHIPASGYTMAQIQVEYGAGRLCARDDFKNYYEFTTGKIYTVMEFEDSVLSPKSWTSISLYKDEYIINILNKLAD